jgi:hypothetical protein
VGGYRSFFEEIGGEDYFWLWELARTYSGVHLSDTIYHYRQHTLQTSLSHKNDLYLFLPELLKELKIAFLNQPWHNAKAALVKEELSSTLVSSAFELNLRRSEQAINRKDLGFSGYAFRTLINIRKPGQTKRLGYLLYSWLAKQLRSQ